MEYSDCSAQNIVSSTTKNQTYGGLVKETKAQETHSPARNQ